MAILYMGIVAALAIGAGILCHNKLVAAYDPDGREARSRRLARIAESAQREESRRDFVKRAGEAAMSLFPVARDREASMASALKRAGFKVSPASYWAATLASIILGIAIGAAAALAYGSASAIARVAVVVLGAAIGFVLPRLVVIRAARKRREAIESILPATLEMLSIVVGAGQTIESGIKTIAERSDGPLADEFAQVDADITYFGRTAGEALSAMAQRLDIPTVSLFAASVAQSLAAGSPIAKVLRSQARIASDNYYMSVEERSNKIRTKMIFPMVAFILPPIFLISLGPTVLRLLTEMPSLSWM